MNLVYRLTRLERFAREARRGDCAECGGRRAPPVEYRLELEHGPRADERERCPACNRQLVFRLEFDRQG